MTDVDVGEVILSGVGAASLQYHGQRRRWEFGNAAGSGTGATGLAAADVAVPEPATIVLVAVFGFAAALNAVQDTKSMTSFCR